MESYTNIQNKDTYPSLSAGSTSESVLDYDSDTPLIGSKGTKKAGGEKKWRGLWQRWKSSRRRTKVTIVLTVLLVVLAIAYSITYGVIGVVIRETKVEMKSMFFEKISYKECVFVSKIKVAEPITGPLNFGLDPGKLTYKGEQFGALISKNKTLHANEAEFYIHEQIKVTNLTTFLDLVQDFIVKDHLGIDFQVGIAFQGIWGMFRTRGKASELQFKAINGIELQMTDYSLLSLVDDQITIETSISFANPSLLRGHIPGVLMEVKYHDQVVCTNIISGIDLAGGVNVVRFPFTINGTGNNLIEDFINKKQLTLPAAVSLAFEGPETSPVFYQNTFEIVALDGIQFEITSLKITNVVNETIILSISITLKNPSPVTAVFELFQSVLYYSKDQIGMVSSRMMKFDHGPNLINLTAELNGEHNQLIQDFILNKHLNVSIHSYVQISKNGNVVPLFNLTVPLDGFDGLIFSLSAFPLLNIHCQSVNFLVEANITNPSQLTATFAKLQIDIYFEGKQIGVASQSSVQLDYGLNRINFTITINTNQSNILFTKFLNQPSVTFQLRGLIFSQESQKGIPVYKSNLTIDSMNGLKYEIMEMSLQAINKDEIIVNGVVNFTNNSPIEAVFSEFDLNLLQNSSFVGKGISNNFALQRGFNKVVFPIVLNVKGTSLLNDFMKKRQVNFNASGSVCENNPLFNYEIAINGFNGFSCQIDSTRLISASSTSLNFEIIVEFNNPTNLKATFSQIIIDVLFENQNIGQAIKKNITLAKQMNKVTFTAALDCTDNDIVQQFILKPAVNLDLVASALISPNAPCSQALNIFNFTLTLDAMNGLPFALNEIKFINATETDLYIEIDASFNNPTSLNALFEQIAIDINYQNKFVGRAVKKNFALNFGENSLKVIAQLNGGGTSLINDFILKSGVNLTLIGNIYPRPNGFLTNKKKRMMMMNNPYSRGSGDDINNESDYTNDDYDNGDADFGDQEDQAIFTKNKPIKFFTTTIFIKSFNGLSPQIINFTIHNANETNLDLLIATTFVNPSSITINLSNIRFGLYVKNQFIGVATKDKMSIDEGKNNFNIIAHLGKQSNELNEFLGSFLAGNDSIIDLRMNVTVSFSKDTSNGFVVHQRLDVVFPGTGVTLVDILFSNLQIHIHALKFQIEYDVFISLTINNPCLFPVTINSFSGPIYFNDLYEAKLFWYDYKPKNNCLLANINADWEKNPLNINGSDKITVPFEIKSTNLEIGIRLNEIFFVKNQLFVNILNGTINLDIGKFSIDVPINIHNVYVPNKNKNINKLTQEKNVLFHQQKKKKKSAFT
ncbi:hypothetical protein M0813_02052 [Anaeramoeba flamelloides]|uniref:Transmembrane protein n=1 Tax=Anaeramoeba flamelloides TaxID=1746091 RepID=A0ABQ8YQC0_9EUKA|nr:hypothetical protein M0813_02052 [Anaeramoeba flamelloides]